jgi:hypothetical protein
MEFSTLLDFPAPRQGSLRDYLGQSPAPDSRTRSLKTRQKTAQNEFASRLYMFKLAKYERGAKTILPHQRQS